VREDRVLERIASVLAAEDEDQLHERMGLAVEALEGEHGLFRIRVMRPPLDPVHHAIRCGPPVRGAGRDSWDDLDGPYAFAALDAGEPEPGWRRHGLPAQLPPITPPSSAPWVAAHHGPGADSVLSIARTQVPRAGSAQERRVADALRLLAGVLHVSVMRLAVPRLFARLAPRLTERETTCLRWVAQGKSDGVVATILGVSDSAVHFHMTNVLRKLGVSTRTQAVAKAMALGLIP